MASPWTQCYNKFNLKNKLDLNYFPKLIYNETNDGKSVSDIVYEYAKMVKNETFYLGIVPKNEVLLKTGFGHFYLYHLYNKDIKNINDLEDSLKLHAIVVINSNAGIHFPIVKKSEYDKCSQTMKYYYVLGSFNGNENKFGSINDLIDYYKGISPQQIISDNKKISNKSNVSDLGNNLSIANNRSPSDINKSMVSNTQKKPIEENKKSKCKEKMFNNNLEEKKKFDKYSMNDSSNTSILLSKKDTKYIKLQKELSTKKCDKKKCVISLKNEKNFKNNLKSTSSKSSIPSTTIIEKFDIKKKDKKLIRDDDFYNSYYLGDKCKKEANNAIKKSFDFAFYHREKNIKQKKRKRIMYMVYKQLEGKLIHLPITRKRNPKYDGSKDSVKRFYVLKTPYDNYEYFNSFKEMVDYFYDRIEEVKELHKKLIN
uniref:SH2 domain-containing protein n=1 Tax=Strongyloides stercoralis TaxID=6248 RepID=A0A0K0E9D5_STRER